LVRLKPVVDVDVNVQKQLIEATLITGMMGHGNPIIPLSSTSDQIANDVIAVIHDLGIFFNIRVGSV
jgi:hypothetical protein